MGLAAPPLLLKLTGAVYEPGLKFVVVTEIVSEVDPPGARPTVPTMLLEAQVMPGEGITVMFKAWLPVLVMITVPTVGRGPFLVAEKFSVVGFTV